MSANIEERLSRELSGDVLFDRFSRGRYATDASFYQIMPRGVVVPQTTADAVATLAIAAEAGVPITARGGGTSQSGQTINDGIVIDGSKHLNRILSLDVAARTVTVEPGIVLDQLNAALKPHGLWFPVDVSTASRATIGGMAGNNSCGGRSIRYGTMRDNVIAIDAVLADGEAMHFGIVERAAALARNAPDLTSTMLALGADNAALIKERFPQLLRRVGGYNLDALADDGATSNLAHLLVGSEGTLAYSTAITLKLAPLIGSKVMGVCHFPQFRDAMEAAQHLVRLGPIAVELIDRTMIDLARAIPLFRPTIDEMVRGDPDALLVVEFAEDPAGNRHRLDALGDMMADLGFAWSDPTKREGGVVDASDPALQARITAVRTSGLNIMMSMKTDAKPVSFVEDCAVALEDLAEYTERLTVIFEKHGTRGTWYAHASVGCLHVRPILNLKREHDVKAMRAIAEDAFEMVRAYKGSHSGEHGDGLVRSEFHDKMFGREMTTLFETVKDRMDPDGVMNPGRIVRAPKMDDRSLFRFSPDYRVGTLETVLDWSAWTGAGGGFQGAIEMCNNNGACRKLAGGAMCPSYRVTRDEKDVTRGRANTLRLAISGQLGPEALTSDEMAETMKLCVSCKACRRECPTSVDMARMKIEVDAARARRHGLSLHDTLIAYLPHFAPFARHLAPLLNLRDRLPGAARASEFVAGFDARRRLPRWRRKSFRPRGGEGAENGREVVLFADTFNRSFEPENLEAATKVLVAAGCRVHHAVPPSGRPLCCGRTFLSAGLTDRAKAEASRTLDALAPFLERGVPVVGLEPSCLFTFRDEMGALELGEMAAKAADAAVLLEEFLADTSLAQTLQPKLHPLGRPVLLHGHCHQKAFGAMGAVEAALSLIPNLSVETVEGSCCGMAGAFGYRRDTYGASIAMAELSLLPAVRAAPEDAIIVADGTSCRHQIRDGSARDAVHVARVLAGALAEDRSLAGPA